MSEYLVEILLALFGVGNVIYFYFWWQAFSYIKENNPLGFLNVFYLVQPNKFKPEGNKYRIKALISLLAVIVVAVILFKVGQSEIST